ncbi:MAG: type II secretion system protein [Steroidobacteraceae bacterium]
MTKGARIAGFTLIELVITVAILGLLATMAMPLVELGAKRAKEQELRIGLRELRDAIDAYKAAVEDGQVILDMNETGYPPSLQTLVEGVEDASSPDLRQIYFLRRVPRDPFFPDPTVPAEQSWGLRSYDSPPEAPRPGDDIFDVYSFSSGVGLNGIPYRDW